MARSSPLPAFSAVAPSAANRPVPIIMAAVRNVAEVLPRARRSDWPDRISFRSAIRRYLRGPSVLPAARGGRSHTARRARSLKVPPSYRPPTRVRIQGVVDRKLSAKPLVIRESQRGEPLRDGSQSKPFRGYGFLSL